MSIELQNKRKPPKTQKKLEKKQKTNDSDIKYGIGIFGVKDSSSIEDESQ